MVRLQDVADKAGVSLTTVSRVLNKDKTLSVSDDTRNKVVKTANELGYKPKKAQKKPSNTIGIFLLYDEKEEIDDPYYLAIRISVKNELVKNNFFVKEFFEDFSYHKDNLKELAGCIIIGSTSMWSEEYSNIIKNWGEPTVFIDFKPDTFEFDYVVSDFDNAIEYSLNYLFNKGYENIGYIGTVDFHISTKTIKRDSREITFTRIMEEKKLLNKNFLYIHTKDKDITNVEIGYKSIKTAFKNNSLPEVFIAENDSIAMGALNALNKLNINVPNEIGIIGCNDNPTSSFLNPPLTTIRIYNKELGISAVEILMKRFKDTKFPSFGIHFSNKLIIRKSLL